MSFFEKQKKRKLYQQWVDKSGLPPESIPHELEPGRGEEDGPQTGEDVDAAEPRKRSILVLRFTVRDLLLMVLIIAVLLVLSSTLATMLVMRSC